MRPIPAPSIAAALAAFAEKAGAAAIVSSTPYYWTPPPAALIEHFAAIAAAVKIPFFVHNAPEEMSGVKVNADLMLKLIDKAKNFAGVVDSGLDWQFMIELITDAPKKRPEFQLVSGVEYMVSAGAIGSRALFAPLAAVAPETGALDVRRLRRRPAVRGAEGARGRRGAPLRAEEGSASPD